MISSAPPIFATLLTGLLIAFAVQLLLTSFGVAAGVTAIGYLPTKLDEEEPKSDQPKSNGHVIGWAVGAGTLLTVNGVLFIACFLAVKLSLSTSLIVGAILGIVIWAAYLLIWVWVSSQAVGSLLGAIFGTLASGLQGLMTTVMEAVSGRKKQSITDTLREQIAAQESALRSLQQEISKEISTTDDKTQTTVVETLQNYLQTLPSPQLDLQTIRNELAEMIHQSDLKSVAAGMPVEFDRASLSALIQDQTDLSQRDVNQLLDQLESVWQEGASQTAPQSQLLDFLQSAQPDVLTQQLTDWLPKPQEQETASSSRQGAMQSLDLKQLARTVLRRVDLSDWDVSKILGQLQSLTGESSAPVNLIQADVEDYLLHAYPWQLTRKTVQQEFKDVIYDPEADPAEISKQLAPLNPDYLTKVLQKRDDLTPAKLSKLVDRLEAVRQTVLTEIQISEGERDQEIDTEATSLWNRFENYISDVNEKLTAKNIQRQVKHFVKDCQSDLADLKPALPTFDRTTIQQRLIDRQDLSEKRIQQLVQQLEKAWNQLSESEPNPVYAASKIHRSTVPIHHLSKAPRRLALRTKTLGTETPDRGFSETLSDYLSNTDKEELTPENIQHDLQQLLHSSRSGLQHLSNPLRVTRRDRISHLDRTALISLLSQRSDLTETEANQIVEQVESNLQHFTQQLQQIQQQMQTTIANTVTQLRDRLTFLELPDLDYDRIKQDVQSLLADPQAGIASLSHRLSAVNRDSILEFLKSRDDLPESIAHQIVDQIDSVRLSLSQQAQHLQQETQQRLEVLKQQAQHQAEETRKGVATAAWWLFGIAFTSAITSAIAGGLAVKLL
ncbi:sulfite exporter TauE/SafE family protein [Phormidesmis sp. 146-33]